MVIIRIDVHSDAIVRQSVMSRVRVVFVKVGVGGNTL
jgi:hypothetical protein